MRKSKKRNAQLEEELQNGENSEERESECYHHICSSKILVSGSILLTGSRVSNESIMNPGGQRGSKSLVNIMNN